MKTRKLLHAARLVSLFLLAVAVHIPQGCKKVPPNPQPTPPPDCSYSGKLLAAKVFVNNNAGGVEDVWTAVGTDISLASSTAGYTKVEPDVAFRVPDLPSEQGWQLLSARRKGHADYVLAARGKWWDSSIMGGNEDIASQVGGHLFREQCPNTVPVHLYERKVAGGSDFVTLVPGTKHYDYACSELGGNCDDIGVIGYAFPP